MWSALSSLLSLGQGWIRVEFFVVRNNIIWLIARKVLVFHTIYCSCTGCRLTLHWFSLNRWSLHHVESLLLQGIIFFKVFIYSIVLLKLSKFSSSFTYFLFVLCHFFNYETSFGRLTFRRVETFFEKICKLRLGSCHLRILEHVSVWNLHMLLNIPHALRWTLVCTLSSPRATFQRVKRPLNSLSLLESFIRKHILIWHIDLPTSKTFSSTRHIFL